MQPKVLQPKNEDMNNQGKQYRCVLYTTRKKLTAGALERLTAGTFVFAGDDLAGGNA